MTKIDEIVKELRASNDPTEAEWANEIEQLCKQLVKNEEVFRKVLHACNVPASYSQERVRGEIVGIISAALTDETRT